MPSQFYQLFAGSAVNVLQTQLAEAAGTIVQWPLGAAANAQDISSESIWNEDVAQDDASRGHENLRKGTLIILNPAQPVDARDLYVINGQTWIVRAVIRPTEPLIEVELETREYEIRNGEGGKKLI